MFGGLVPGVRAGDRYRYLLDGDGPYPDPASRFQPEGVHGPSEVVDPDQFPWSDGDWKGIPLDELILYELHVGTFSPEGTFAGVTARLPHVVALGVSAIELMPVSDFPGERNWGYDGVALFAPARCYGHPDDLRRLVDTSHRAGLAVLLDVVYNHLGPDGSYLTTFSPFYRSNRHHTPWGAAVNFDDEHSHMVREFFVENALHWIHEYHLDGLRLDATHALVDESLSHFIEELPSRVRASIADRRVLLIAEDDRNLAYMVQPKAEGGWGLDTVWSDDLHHQLRVLLAGDREGCFEDFTGTLPDVVSTIQRGWFYCGQYSAFRNAPRGTDPSRIPPSRFVIYLQNHDRIGNRAMGERLHQQIPLDAFRAASALLLCCPQTPLLFMGQEWAASTPFRFFTDHQGDLGRRVTEGRRREFRRFSAFADPQVWARIPDPQDPATFDASRLRWAEREEEPHASMLRLHQALLRVRRTEPALRDGEGSTFGVEASGESSLVLRREAANGGELWLVVQLRGGGTVALADLAHLRWAVAHPSWEVILTTEDPPYSPDPSPPQIEGTEEAPVIRFHRPSALLLRVHPHTSKPLDIHGRIDKELTGTRNSFQGR